MKIALTVEDFRPWRGGGEGYVFGLAGRLVRLGHEVHVFAGRIGDVPDGIAPHDVPLTGLLPRRATFALNCARMLDEAAEEFDLVHGFGKSIRMDVFRPGGGVHRAWRRLEPLSVENPARRAWRRFRRHFSFDQRLVLWLEAKQFAPGADGPEIIANSNMVRRHVLEHYNVPESRIHVIPNGVDGTRFTPANRARCREAVRTQWGVADDDVVVLFVANNFRLKGLLPLVRALARLPRSSPPVKVVAVGRDRQGPYRALAGQLGCADRLIFAGATTKTEEAYAAADVFAHPTFYDPCANVTLEAMASGLPVVTSVYNGAGELLTPDAGAVIDPEHPEALAGAIEAFLDPACRAAAGTAARRIADAHNPEWHLGKVLEVYNDALARKRG